MPRTKQSSQARQAIAKQRKARWRQQVASGQQQNASRPTGLQFINSTLNPRASAGAGKNDHS